MTKLTLEQRRRAEQLLDEMANATEMTEYAFELVALRDRLSTKDAYHPHHWTVEKSDHSSYRDTWSRDVRYAGPGNRSLGGASVIEGKHFSASGKTAFGGAASWPHVTVEISLPVDRVDLRTVLGKLMRDTIDSFVNEHDLALHAGDLREDEPT